MTIRETKYVKMKDFWQNHYSMLPDSYKKWLLVILWWMIKKQTSKRQNFREIYLSFSIMIFALSVAGCCFSMSSWRYSYVFMGYRKGFLDWNGLIFQLTKVLFTNKFWVYVNVGFGGSGCFKKFFESRKCMSCHRWI